MAKEQPKPDLEKETDEALDALTQTLESNPALVPTALHAINYLFYQGSALGNTKNILQGLTSLPGLVTGGFGGLKGLVGSVAKAVVSKSTLGYVDLPNASSFGQSSQALPIMQILKLKDVWQQNPAILLEHPKLHALLFNPAIIAALSEKGSLSMLAELIEKAALKKLFADYQPKDKTVQDSEKKEPIEDKKAPSVEQKQPSKGLMWFSFTRTLLNNASLRGVLVKAIDEVSVTKTLWASNGTVNRLNDLLGIQLQLDDDTKNLANQLIAGMVDSVMILCKSQDKDMDAMLGALQSVIFDGAKIDKEMLKPLSKISGILLDGMIPVLSGTRGTTLLAEIVAQKFGFPHDVIAQVLKPFMEPAGHQSTKGLSFLRQVIKDPALLNSLFEIAQGKSTPENTAKTVKYMLAGLAPMLGKLVNPEQASAASSLLILATVKNLNNANQKVKNLLAEVKQGEGLEQDSLTKLIQRVLDEIGQDPKYASLRKELSTVQTLLEREVDPSKLDIFDSEVVNSVKTKEEWPTYLKGVLNKAEAALVDNISKRDALINKMQSPQTALLIQDTVSSVMTLLGDANNVGPLTDLITAGVSLDMKKAGVGDLMNLGKNALEVLARLNTNNILQHKEALSALIEPFLPLDANGKASDISPLFSLLNQEVLASLNASYGVLHAEFKKLGDDVNKSKFSMKMLSSVIQSPDAAKACIECLESVFSKVTDAQLDVLSNLANVFVPATFKPTIEGTNLQPVLKGAIGSVLELVKDSDSQKALTGLMSKGAQFLLIREEQDKLKKEQDKLSKAAEQSKAGKLGSQKKVVKAEVESKEAKQLKEVQLREKQLKEKAIDTILEIGDSATTLLPQMNFKFLEANKKTVVAVVQPMLEKYISPKYSAKLVDIVINSLNDGPTKIKLASAYKVFRNTANGRNWAKLALEALSSKEGRALFFKVAVNAAKGYILNKITNLSKGKDQNEVLVDASKKFSESKATSASEAKKVEKASNLSKGDMSESKGIASPE